MYRMSRLHKFLIAGMLIAAFLLAAGCTQQQSGEVVQCEGSDDGTCPLPASVTAGATAAVAGAASVDTGERVRLETNMGDIVIALDPDMPITAGNFRDLVVSGYYDGVIFHRVIDGFMIQGGDPTGTGRGGPGYTIPDEFTSNNRNDRGTISMANAGANTGGSQFFINLVDNNRLDTKHPVFGKVVECMDVVDAIGKVATGAGDRPLQDVTIIRAVVI
jgi:peptidylprolyl isomerase